MRDSIVAPPFSATRSRASIATAILACSAFGRFVT